jgi:hypothetical protein
VCLDFTAWPVEDVIPDSLQVGKGLSEMLLSNAINLVSLFIYVFFIFYNYRHTHPIQLTEENKIEFIKHEELFKNVDFV